MHHDVGDASERLIGGDGIGEFGIFDREDRTDKVAVEPLFDFLFVVLDDAGVA